MPDDDHNTTDHAALLAEIERERQSRLAAQVRVEQLHAEVARLEPMRQRAADIARLTRERDEARAELGVARVGAEQYRIALGEISWSNDSSWQAARANEALNSVDAAKVAGVKTRKDERWA